MRARLVFFLGLASLVVAIAPAHTARANGDAAPVSSAQGSPKSAAPVTRPGPRAATLAELPAISDDGRLVAAAMHVSDGARGSENLEFGLFAMWSGRQTKSIVVVDPNDPEKPGRAQREAEANKLLSPHLWVPLVPYTLREDATAPLRQGGVSEEFRNDLAEGEGLVLSYHEPMLEVRDAAQHVLFRRREPSFSKPGGPRCKGCVDCPAPLANLSAVWGDRERRVLFVEIGYHGGTDTCWEPDETFHVVRF